MLEKLYSNLILYLFYEDYIQPESTSSSPRKLYSIDESRMYAFFFISEERM